MAAGFGPAKITAMTGYKKKSCEKHLRWRQEEELEGQKLSAPSKENRKAWCMRVRMLWSRWSDIASKIAATMDIKSDKCITIDGAER